MDSSRTALRLSIGMCMESVNVMGQTAIDGVEGLYRLGEISRFSGSRSVALPPIPFWPCLYFATVATADYHGTVAHRHVDHAGTMCADYVAQFRSSQLRIVWRSPLILLIADMACYSSPSPRHLPPMPAFIDGTAPLIAVTVFSEIVVAMIV